MDEYEEQAERITKQIRNKTKTLKRKALTIDSFDWDVKNADSLYDSLNNDYVRLHNEVQALEEVTAMIDKINNRQVTKDGVFKFLMEFGRIYNNLPEINKKELANKFIDKIEIFPEEKEDGSVIKSVTFRFPLKSNGDKIGMKGGTGLTTGTPVETVVQKIGETVHHRRTRNTINLHRNIQQNTLLSPMITGMDMSIICLHKRIPDRIGAI